MASPGSSGCSRRRTLLTQTAAGTISRTIRDGTFLPGAPLIITNPETAQPRTLVADMVGRPASPDLLPACRDERVAARAHLGWLRCLTHNCALRSSYTSTAQGAPVLNSWVKGHSG